jgi:energy-converting hydrogenase Eha subunit C
MNRYPIFTSIFWGLITQLSTYSFMSIAENKSWPILFKAIGLILYATGFLPALYSADLMAFEKPRGHDQEIIYISFYYLAVGFLSGILATLYGKDPLEKIGIFSAVFFGFIIVSAFVFFLLWAASAHES